MLTALLACQWITWTCGYQLPSNKFSDRGLRFVDLAELPVFPHDFANAYFSPSQEYFANFKNEIGPVKKAAIAYSPNGVSRGTCNVTFVRPDGAKKAYLKLNGLLIDNKAIVVSRTGSPAHYHTQANI